MLKTLNSKKVTLIIFGFVVLGGVGFGGYRYCQLTRSQTPAPVEPQEPTTESKWKLYTNSEYGFSVEVPASWTQHEEGVYSSKGSWLSVEVYANEAELDTLRWIERDQAEYPNLYRSVEGGIPTELNAVVAGREAVYLHYPGGSLAPTRFLVVFTKDTLAFEIEIANPEREDALEVFQHALETFRFEGEGESEVRLPEFPNLEYGVKVP